jgi:alpha-1,3-rhamnosyl/mannosyltransferase
MRVCIDAAPLLVRSAGVKNYLYYWLLHLRRLAGDDAIRLFPPLGTIGPLDHEHSLAVPARSFAGLAALAVANYTVLPVAEWMSRGCDLFHTTNLLRRLPRSKRLTTTLHDATTWLMPEVHSHANRRADDTFARTLRLADAVIAVSANTKNDAVRLLGMDDRKITVIHSGVSAAFFNVTAEHVGTTRQALHLIRPYVLFVGTIEPRKNIDVLLDAWQSLAAELRGQFDLVLAGPPGWAAQELLDRLRNPPSGVRYLGYVAESYLPGLTAGAEVFVYPSLYEGFGFPLAQAMAAGVPAVTSDLSSLPEVANGAAVLVDPHSPAELSSAIEHLLLSPDARARLRVAGLRRAQVFTWEECARKSLEFFRKVIG